MQLFPDSDATPQLVRLADMRPDQTGDCFVLLVSRERGTTRDGKPYFRVTFRDAARTASSMIWSDGGFFAECERDWKPGTFYKIRCRYSESNYGPQVEIDRIRVVTQADVSDGFDPGDFFEASRFDPETMFAELHELVAEHVADEPLRRLITELLDENAQTIKTHPAASRNHHAFRSGYLEHVLSVTRTAIYLADKYGAYYTEMRPTLNKSLVVAGAVLHDIGKLIELDAGPQGAGYTARGKLIGHILLGRDIVRDKAATIADFDPETLLRLEHIIISHQNLPEWGSPIAPHTPEALLVYFADDIDAKFHMVATALESEPANAEEFTGRDNALRRQVFRGLAGNAGE